LINVVAEARVEERAAVFPCCVQRKEITFVGALFSPAGGVISANYAGVGNLRSAAAQLVASSPANFDSMVTARKILFRVFAFAIGRAEINPVSKRSGTLFHTNIYHL